MSDEPCLRAGQAWLGQAVPVRGRTIRLTAIDGDFAHYEVARVSEAPECRYCPPGGLSERSLREAYRLATATEQEGIDAAEVPDPMTLSAVQQAVMAHKRARGFNTTDLSLEMRLLTEELAELSRAERMMAPASEVGGEVADVIIFALSIAGLLGLDAGEVVAAKIRANKARTYRTLPNGTHVRA